MSKEHAKKFVDHLKRDEALRKKVRDASEHVLKVAKDHGYDLTREEISGAVKENWSNKPHDEDDPHTAFFSEAPGF